MCSFFSRQTCGENFIDFSSREALSNQHMLHFKCENKENSNEKGFGRECKSQHKLKITSKKCLLRASQGCLLSRCSNMWWKKFPTDNVRFEVKERFNTKGIFYGKQLLIYESSFATTFFVKLNNSPFSSPWKKAPLRENEYAHKPRQFS